MNEILKTVEALNSAPAPSNGKSPLKDFGFISCANTVHIKHVPFYDPCLIVVLAGRKTVFDTKGPLSCGVGEVLVVLGPSSFDIRNEPDARAKAYRALIIPFKYELLERLSRAHELAHDHSNAGVGALKFDYDAVFVAALKHYLAAVNNFQLLSHRLMELLLILAGRNPNLLAYVFQQASWSRRVRSIVAADLARAWDIGVVCACLATTESTLRRHLKKENTGFRELLYEVRLSAALMQLLQTSLPVYRIAYDCGYQSVSRFTHNFHKRFGLPPKDFRVSMGESEHSLTVSEQFPIS